MAKKYGAKHITIFAVYKKFMLLGNIGRDFKVAFPDKLDAEKWIEAHCNSYIKKEDYIIEEMSAIMKAWQP